MASRQKNQISTKSSEQTVKEWMTAMEEKLPANKPAPSVLEQTAFAQRLRAKLAEIGEQDFMATMNRVITECTFFQMPTWSEIEARVPVRPIGSYQKPTEEDFRRAREAQDSPEQKRFLELVRKLKMDPVKVAEVIPQVRKEPKAERQELQEVQSKGMKAKVVDGKAAGANDK